MLYEINMSKLENLTLDANEINEWFPLSTGH